MNEVQCPFCGTANRISREYHWDGREEVCLGELADCQHCGFKYDAYGNVTGCDVDKLKALVFRNAITDSPEQH